MCPMIPESRDVSDREFDRREARYDRALMFGWGMLAGIWLMAVLWALS